MAQHRESRLERIRRSPNFRDGVFHNALPTRVMHRGSSLAVTREWLTNRDRRRPSAPLPSVPLTRGFFTAPAQDDVRVCWLGHSSVLLELAGARLLTDPVWSERASPSQRVGPARFQPVPLALQQLPELTAVLISHDHYDHLDRGFIEFMVRSGSRVPFYVPLGVGAHLERWGVAPERIHELDWWEEATLVAGRLRLVSAPAQHFSGRGLFDRNRTLWTSWAVLGRTHRVYFGGDGGYHPGFADIARRLGPFDLTMLEIGAYHPSWGDIHLGPENALRAHRELEGRHLLPIHWGTFDLGIHAWDEPIMTLKEHAPVEGARLLLPRLGQQVRLSEVPDASAWWRDVA